MRDLEKKWNYGITFTTLDVTKRGPASDPQMPSRAQEICMALGAAELISVHGAKDITRELKAYRAPDALDAVFQEAVGPLRRRRIAGNIFN